MALLLFTLAVAPPPSLSLLVLSLSVLPLATGVTLQLVIPLEVCGARIPIVLIIKAYRLPQFTLGRYCGRGG